MSLLPNGKVLITGGYVDTGSGASATALADLYDPETGRVTPVGPMLHPRARHTSTVLRTGKILLIGGGDSTAELFDADSEQFTAAGAMVIARADHTATLLPDGTVMIVGGSGDTSTERYNPTSKSFVLGKTLAVIRNGHTATLTASDPVQLVISGGLGDVTDGGVDFRVTEVFEPAINQWRISGSLLPTNSATGGQEGSTIGLSDGRLLMTGVSPGTLGAVTLGQAHSWVFSGDTWIDHGGCLNISTGLQTLVLPDGQPYAFGSLEPTGGSGCYGLIPTPNLVRLETKAGSSSAICTPLPPVSTEVVRREGTGAVLPNGSVLIAGGLNLSDACNWAIQKTMSVVRKDGPITSAGGGLGASGRFDAAASTLGSGAVLVSGGTDGGVGALSSAEFYSNGRSSKSFALTTGRAHHTSTVLIDGRVLLAGGLDVSGAPLANAELLDLSSGQPGVLIALQHARAFHTATLLPDGRVLLTGGVTDGGVASSSELFSPTTLRTASAAELAVPRSHHAAAMLGNGSVVVAGGQVGSSILNSAEVFTNGSPWSAAKNLNGPRTDFTLTEVGDKLIAIGGRGTGGVPLAVTELLDGPASSWVPGPPLAAPRFNHTATVLTTGQVVVAGGYGPALLDTTEIYDVQTGQFTGGQVLKTPAGRHASARTTGGALLFGGEGGANAVNAISDGIVVLPSLQPVLSAVPPAVAPAESFQVTGVGLEGYGENGGGSRRSVSTNQPIFFVTRFDGEGRRFLSASDWSGTYALVTVPVDLLGGVYWLRVSVGGAISEPVVLRVGGGDSTACNEPTECLSGYCVAHACCSPPLCGPSGDAGTDSGTGLDAGLDAGSSAVDGGVSTAGDGGVNARDGGGSMPGDAGDVAADGGVPARGADLYSCGCSEGGAPGSLIIWALAGVLLFRRRGSAGPLVLVLLALPLAARAEAPAKVAVGELRGGAGVSKELPDVVADQLIVELQQRGFEVTSSKDISAQLGHERERQLMGCSSDTSCLAEVGAALDVAFIITGSISKVGNSLALSINAVNTRKSSATKHYATRIKPATEEAVLDLLPTIVSQLFPESKRVEKGVEAAPVPLPPPVAAQIEPSAPPPLITTVPIEPQQRVRHFAAWVRGQLSPLGAAGALHGAVMPFVGFRFDERWAVSAGFVAAQPLGVTVRASAVPFFVESRIHPLVALEVPVLFASSLALGIGTSVGAEWVPLDWLSIALEVPVQYFIVAPEAATRFWVFGALSVGVRL